jgi:hypothetical protein
VRRSSRLVLWPYVLFVKDLIAAHVVPKEAPNAAIQRLVSLHRQLSPLNHGRGDYEPQGCTELRGLQRRKPPGWCSALRGHSADRVGRSACGGAVQQIVGRVCKGGFASTPLRLYVCDKAAQEICPIWPGQPMTAHWGVPDPAAAQGSAEEIDRAYRQAFSMLERRITLMLALPLASLDSLSIKRELDIIGKQ